MKLRLTFAATTALFTLTALASAQEQPWVKDRRYGEGIGLRSGNLEWHPGLAGEFGYDSNYFQRDDGEPGRPVEDAWRLRVTPSLSVATLGARKREATTAGAAPALQFEARAFAAYNEFFGSEFIREQRRLDYGAGFRADIAPQRRFGADVSVDFLRTGEPSNDARVDVAFDRGTVRGGAGVSWRPGGGLFDWRLGYEASYNYFEDASFETLSNVEHGPVTRGRWRFLPRTALLYDARYMMVRYLNESAFQPNGDYVEARAGLSGLFTTRWAFLAMLGWNSSYYEAAANGIERNYDGFVAHGELKWYLLPPASEGSAQIGLSSIAAGYVRSFSNSYLGAFYVRDRGYANLEYFVGGVFMASLEGGISHVNFPDVAETQPGFSQNRFDVKLYAEYRMSDVFAVNSTISYDQVLMPDGQVSLGGEQEEDLEYSRFQAYLGARLFW